MEIRRLASSLALVALVGAGCGNAATPNPTPAPAAVATTAPSAEPTATAAPPAPSQRAPLAQLAAAGKSLVIHLILDPTTDTTVHVGTLTGCTDSACQGDYMIGHDRLTDADTGRDAGTFSYQCFLVDPASTLYHCPGITITLTDRGQITFTELIEHLPGRPPAVSPITGGTGEFLGATGTVTGKVLSGSGDFVIAISK
jgi:hypothetical protein